METGSFRRETIPLMKRMMERAKAERRAVTLRECLVGFTASDFARTAVMLASDDEFRRRVEAEWNESLPDGYSVRIDGGGVAHLAAPPHVTSPGPSASSP